MKRNEIKIAAVLGVHRRLTKKEVAAIKKAISGEVIKVVSPEGKEPRTSIIEYITHVEVVHPKWTA